MTEQDWTDDYRDGLLFRFWIKAASWPGGFPSECANAIAKCRTPSSPPRRQTMTQLSDFAIGVAGGAMSLFLANRFWYPAPDVEGVALGLLLAGIFFAGALPAIIISRLISHD